MASTLTAFFDKPWTKIILSYLVVLCIGMGIGVWGHIRWQTPPAPEVRIVENVKYVDVPVEKVVYKDVVKYVTDQTEVKKLLAEQASAKNEIKTLTETIARLKTVTTTTETKTVFVEVPGAPEAHFKDWRLTFDATPAQTTYQLDQKFEALAAIGKDKTGKPVVSTKLFEIGPGEKRTELTEARTTVVTAVPNPKRWFFGFNISAGFGGTISTTSETTHANNAVTTTFPTVAGGVVGVRWVTRGTSKAAEDGSWSLLTPVAFISTDGAEFGVLPVSVNLGKIPKQPFKDLWASPIVVFGKAPNTSPTRVGFVFTATF